MTIANLIGQLRYPTELPTDALNELIARKEESTPALLGVLQEVLDNFRRVNTERMDHIFALYILSYFREQKAFHLIMKFATLPENSLRELLGDFYLEDLANWIVSTYNGDLQAIKKLIENETACNYARSAVLSSLLGLIAIDKLSRDEVINYFRQLIYSDLIKDYKFASWVVDEVYHLYPEELYDDVKKLYDNDMVDSQLISMQDVDDMLKKPKDECLERWVYTNKYANPVTDVFEYVSTIQFDDEEEFNIDISDPCPCGSTKTFNDCCLSLLTKEKGKQCTK